MLLSGQSDTEYIRVIITDPPMGVCRISPTECSSATIDGCADFLSDVRGYCVLARYTTSWMAF